MTVHNADIAAIFTEIADLLEIEGKNAFRVRAYRNAAREIESTGKPVAERVANEEDLTQLPAIGEDLAAKIREIVATGRCRALEELRQELPPTITALLKMPGLGPKRVKTLHQELEVGSLADLKRAAQEGAVRQLSGFGEKTERAILEALEQHAETEHRFKLATAAQYAEPLVAHLKEAREVVDVVTAGSYRRARETVGDLDILVTTRGESDVMERFAGYDEVREVVSRGETRATVILRSGLQVDLRVVPQASFGAALHYFTGSKAHNIAVRRLGQQKKLKINEYGVFRGDKRIAGAGEEEVFAAVNLPWIPPELRENSGEIEAARAGELPKLIEARDLRGDLHAHTRATDGHHTLEELAEAARARGFRYLAITEHSRRLTMVHGLDAKRLRRQCAEIDRLNENFRGFRLLKGIEVDILEDGRLDLPDEALRELDLVIGAVHSKFNLPRAKQTERILRAMDSRYFTILAHPTGRLIGEREAYDVDMPRIVRHARDRGCFLELNAHPERLDLNDTHCRMAREEGVLVAIDSDAHRLQDFDGLRFGVGQARRGWLESRDVLNTRTLRQLRPLLKRTMS